MTFDKCELSGVPRASEPVIVIIVLLVSVSFGTFSVYFSLIIISRYYYLSFINAYTYLLISYFERFTWAILPSAIER